MAKNIKGRKFVATAASAALVASAIVPVASAAGFGDQSKISSWAADAVAHAVEKGYMKGANGNFNPQGTITKGEVAQVIFNALELKEGKEGVFTDVPSTEWYAKAVNALYAAEIALGNEGKFEPNKDVTLAEAANLIVKALGIKGTADLSKFADASSVPTWANEAIQALVANGYIKGNSNGGVLTLGALDNLSRERFATFFVATAVDTIEKETPGATAIKEFKAVGAKKFEVTFDGIADKAKIVLKKGTVVVNVDDIKFSEDKKSAIITTTAPLTKGDYTVTVTELTKEALVSTVTVADEKVATINVLSETAPMNPAATTVDTVSYNAYETAFVKYEVLNQYGETMRDIPITWTVSTGGKYSSNNNGSLTIGSHMNAGSAFIPGTVVYLTGVHTTTGTVVNGQVKIGLESKASEAKILGVYDVDNSKLVDLPAGFNDDTRYALLFEVVDQYGNKIDSPNLTQFTYLSNNPLFVGQPTAGSNQSVTINGKTYQGVFLPAGSSTTNGGTATITLISNNTGKSASYTIKADAVAKVAKLEVSTPAELVAGEEEVELAYTAVDQYGNPVTSFNKLDAATTGVGAYINLSSNLRFVPKADGTAKLVYTAPVNNTPADIIDTISTLVTTTGNYKNLQLTIKPKAVPTTIVGLDKEVTTAIAAGNTVEIEATDLIVQDQYGRNVSDAKFTTWLNQSNTSIVLSSDAVNGHAITTATIGGSGTDGSLVVDHASKTFTVAATTALGTSTENLVFSLSNVANNTPVTASAKSFVFKRVFETEYVSFEVADFATMYYDGDVNGSELHDITPKVYGVTESGDKVLLPASQYTLNLLGVNASTPEVELNGSKITDVASADSLFVDTNGQKVDRTVRVSVVIKDTATGAAATEIIKPLVISAKTPVVTTVVLNPNVVNEGKAFVSKVAGEITMAELDDVFFVLRDQYGVTINSTPTVLITNVTKVSGSNFSLAGNNTTAPVITGAAAGDKFTATFKFAGGETQVIEFTVAHN